MFQDLGTFESFSVEKLSVLPKIGEGLGRNVYALDDDHCLKYPRWDEGVMECQVEAKIYQQAEGKYKKLLCPVVYDGNGFNVMKKAIPVEYVRVNDTIYQYINQKRKITEFIDYLVNTFDMWKPDLEKVSQWGYVDGKLVLLDYGRNMELMKDCHI